MTEEPKIKRIPYGISDFIEFRKSNFYYVDKTRFIRNIEEKGNYLFFIRPRRFGKSLFLSILESYYDIVLKDRFDFLFKGTEIYKKPSAERNRYMVLTLDFSMVNPDTARVEEAFIDYVRETAFSFLVKYEKLLDIDLQEAKEELFAKKSAPEVLVILLNFCKRKEQKLYVIIDEYDNFANTILSTAGEKLYRDITHGEGFLRAFFNVLKGGTSRTNAPISRLFMTGVSPITLDDVTSGFNIAGNISLDPDLNEMMGFTRREVEAVIEYYKLTGKINHSTPELMEIMSRWYNHYRFSLYSSSEVFNTFHVLYFLKQYITAARIPTGLIDRNARIDYNKLRHLILIDQKGTLSTNGNFSKLQQIIESGEVHSTIETGFPIDQLTNPNNFISLLYYFGLLTIGGIDDENTPILSIPNETVKQLYYDYISETYREAGDMSLDMFKYGELIKDMAYRGDWQALVEYIAGRMESSLSIRDLISGEKALQVFWNVYLGLGSLYLVYSEKEMNQGYADLVLVPLLIQFPTIKYSYIIELKYIKPSADKKEKKQVIEKLEKEAEDQLKRYSPDEKFKKSIGKTLLKKIILVFRGNHLVHHREV